jgi:hypothetical protein
VKAPHTGWKSQSDHIPSIWAKRAIVSQSPSMIVCIIVRRLVAQIRNP